MMPTGNSPPNPIPHAAEPTGTGANPWAGHHVVRATGVIGREPVMGDAMIRRLYEDLPRFAPGLLRTLTTRVASRVLAYLAFDAPFVRGDVGGFVRANGIDLREATPPPGGFRTRRDVFLRELDYERVRPMPDDGRVVVSAADAKLVTGDWSMDEALPIKNRFFGLDELLRHAKWRDVFAGGSWAIFRLAPPDYHWFHAPVTGSVVETWGVDGWYYSVNPRAVRALPHVLSTNARAVCVIDSDVPGGTRAGRVALIPVAAQVIGLIRWSYRDSGYANERGVRAGLWVERGRPMGYFAPGSSTVVALFEKDRVRFDDDLLAYQQRNDVPTLYTESVFGRRVAEVAVRVRESLGRALPATKPSV